MSPICLQWSKLQMKLKEIFHVFGITIKFTFHWSLLPLSAYNSPSLTCRSHTNRFSMFIMVFLLFKSLAPSLKHLFIVVSNTIHNSERVYKNQPPRASNWLCATISTCYTTNTIVSIYLCLQLLKCNPQYLIPDN